MLLSAIAALSLCLIAPQTPVKIAGQQSVIVLFNDGTVGGFGLAIRGAIGPLDKVPVYDLNASKLVPIKLPQKAKDIMAGQDQSYALLADGTVVGWGILLPSLVDQPRLPKITNGQEGFENPMPIPGLKDIVAIAGHGDDFLALDKNGEVYEWCTLLYNKGYKPRKVEGLRDITQISLMGTKMALDKAGNVYTWGWVSVMGTLGRETNPERPEMMKGISNIVSIASGNSVSTVTAKNGSVWVWGSNYCCQLGFGPKTEMPVLGSPSNKLQKTPKQIPGLQNVARVINSDGNYSVAILRDGTLRTWGRNDLQQLGLTNGTWYPNIIGKPAISNVVNVWVLTNTAFALTKDGSLYTWGDKFRGRYPLSQIYRKPTRIKLN